MQKPMLVSEVESYINNKIKPTLNQLSNECHMRKSTHLANSQRHREEYQYKLRTTSTHLIALYPVMLATKASPEYHRH